MLALPFIRRQDQYYRQCYNGQDTIRVIQGLYFLISWTSVLGNTPTPDDEGDDDASSYPLMVNVFKRLLLTCHSSLPLLLANFGDLLLEGLPPVREVDEWVCLLEVFGTLGKATTLTTVEDGDDTEHSEYLPFIEWSSYTLDRFIKGYYNYGSGSRCYG